MLTLTYANQDFFSFQRWQATNTILFQLRWSCLLSQTKEILWKKGSIESLRIVIYQFILTMFVMIEIFTFCSRASWNSRSIKELQRETATLAIIHKKSTLLCAKICNNTINVRLTKIKGKEYLFSVKLIPFLLKAQGYTVGHFRVKSKIIFTHCNF